jgi:hypothetical protein
MKLTHTATALVEVELDARTKVDHRTRRLNETPMLRTLLKHYGYSVRHADNGLLYAEGLACREADCGATWHDLEAHPSMRFDTRSATYPGNPEFVVCTVCNGSRETAAMLFPRLCAKQRAKVLDTWGITKLLMADHQAVRCGGKTIVTAGPFQQAAKAVTPKRVDLESEFEAVLVRAPTLDVAIEAVRSDSFPSDAFVTVPLTFELWPKNRWHGEPMTRTDSAPIERFQRQQRRDAEAAVEAEVAQFRDEIAQRQRAQ